MPKTQRQQALGQLTLEDWAVITAPGETEEQIYEICSLAPLQMVSNIESFGRENYGPALEKIRGIFFNAEDKDERAAYRHLRLPVHQRSSGSDYGLSVQ